MSTYDTSQRNTQQLDTYQRDTEPGELDIYNSMQKAEDLAVLEIIYTDYVDRGVKAQMLCPAISEAEKESIFEKYLNRFVPTFAERNQMFFLALRYGAKRVDSTE